MKIAPKGKAFIPKPLGVRSYFNEAYGSALWDEIVDWRARNYPRKSWSPTPPEKESTLKTKLYNSLKWLVTEGSKEQKDVCGAITFAKIGNEYVLSLRRRGIDTFRAARVTPLVESPRELERSAHGPDVVYQEVRRDLIKFLCEITYDGVSPKRPVYQRAGVTLTPERRDELVSYVEAHGGFAADITAGYNGTIMVIPLTKEEQKDK